MKITISINTNELYTTTRNLWEMVYMVLEELDGKSLQEIPSHIATTDTRNYLGDDGGHYDASSSIEVTNEV